MGFAIGWCAVREDQGEALLREFGLARTGRTLEGPDSEVSMCRLASGWRLFMFEDPDARLITDKRLPHLSMHRELLVCRVEEHVMESSAELWSGSARQWQLYHAGEDGPKGLDVLGTPPPCLAGIRAEMEGKQRDANGEDADVDYLFEIPLLVAREIAGFKHDESTDIPIVWLELEYPKTGGFLSRLFGP